MPLHSLPGPETEPGGDAHWTEHIQPLLDNAYRKIFGFRPPDDHIPGLRFDATTKAIAALGQILAALPGRKNLIWITHGVPSLIPDISGMPIDMTAAILRFGVMLEHEHVAVYTVDQTTEGNFAPLDSDSSQTLQRVSDLTGGRYYGADAVAEAIHQARADSRASYTAGYFPPPRNWNGKFHKIRISVVRSGLRLRTIQGYNATPLASDEHEQDVLTMASSSPFDSPEIGLRAETAAPDPASKLIRLKVRVDPADVLFRAQGDSSEADLLLAIFQDDATVAGPGQLYGFASRQNPPVTIPVHLSLRGEEREKVMKNGITVTREVALDPTSHRLKVVALDRDTEEYGSLSIPAGGAQ